MAIPPYEEQIIIAKYIEKEKSRMTALSDKIHEEINLLKEYKIALINEVVTGKVDVREAVLVKLNHYEKNIRFT